jgi:hypothetical protein
MNREQSIPNREENSKMCVLYDKSTGIIHHVQHTLVAKRGYQPTLKDMETLARWSLRLRGIPQRNLEVFHLPKGIVSHLRNYTVDIGRRLLIPPVTLEGAKPIAEARPVKRPVSTGFLLPRWRSLASAWRSYP